MSTVEKLFVQIFDRKRQISEQLNHQKQLYEQHLASKLLIQGITPPPWLLQSEGFASSTFSSNPRDLNKEDLIHDLLLPRPKPPASYPNASHLYAKLFPTATRDELQYDLFNASSALCKGFDDSRPGVPPQCLFKGQEDTHDHVAESPLDSAVPKNDPGLDQSLARIQRSRSRQKALEIRSSRKSSSKRRLEDNPPTVTAEQEMPIQHIAAVDRNLSPVHMSLAKGDTSCREGEASRHFIKQMDASTHCQTSPSDYHKLSIVESLVAPDSYPRNEREFSMPVAHEPDVEHYSEDNLPTVIAVKDTLIQGSEAADRNLGSSTHSSLAKRPKTSSNEVEAFRHTIKKMDASTICLSPPSNCQDLSMEKSAVAPDGVPRKEREFSGRIAHEPDVECQIEDNLPTVTAERDLLIWSAAVDRTLSSTAHNSLAKKQKTCEEAEAFRHTAKKMGASTICPSTPSDCQDFSIQKFAVAPDSVPGKEREISKGFADEPDAVCHLEENPSLTAEQYMLIQGSGAVGRNSNMLTHKSVAEVQNTSCKGAEALRHAAKEMGASTICRSIPGDCQNSPMEGSLVAPDSAPSGKWEISQHFANEPEVKRLLEDNLPTETAEQDMLIQGSRAVDRNSSPPAHKFIAEMQDTSCNGVDGFRHTIKEVDASAICRSLPDDCQNSSMEESLVAPDSAPSMEREISKCFAYEPEVKRLFEGNLPIETAEQETLIQGSAAVDRNMSPTNSTKQMDASTTCWSLPGDCQNLSAKEPLVAHDCAPSSEREISERFADEPNAMTDVSCDGISPTYNRFTEELIENQGLCCDEEETSGSHPEESNTAIEMGGTYTVQKEESSYLPCSLSLAGQTVIVNGPSESCVCDDVKSFETNKILESSFVQVTRDASVESPPLKADDFPSDGVNFSGECNGPCASPGRKLVDGVAGRSGVSNNQGISSPELAFFLVDEGGGEDGNLDDSDHTCPGETGSLRDSLLCFSKDNKRAVDSALNVAGLGSHSTEISLSCSDRQKLNCFPVRRSEQDVNGVDTLKTRQEEAGCIRQPLCSISNTMIPTIDPLSNEAPVPPSDCQKTSMEESLLAPDFVPSNEMEISGRFADKPDAVVNASCDEKSPQYNPFTEELTESQGLCCEVEEISGSRLEESNTSIEVGGTYTVQKEESCYDPFSLSSAGQTAIVNGPLEGCVGDDVKSFEANKILESSSAQVTLDASLGSLPLKADDLPSNGANFSGEFKGPCVSPGRKIVDGVAASSAGSGNRGISSPELACFQIDESGEEDGNADSSDHICSEETGSLRSSLLCVSIDKMKSIDSALNTASFGSHCTETFLSDSDRQRGSNAVLGSFPVGRGIEQDVNGVEALKTCQEETDCIRQPLCDISSNMVPTIDSLANKVSDPPSDYQNFSTEESLAVPDCVFSGQREDSETFADEPDAMIDIPCDGKSPKYNPIIEELIENHGLRFKEEEISRSRPDESDTSIEMVATYIVQKEESSCDPCLLLSAGQTAAVNGPLESCVGDDFKSLETNKILGLSSFQVTQDASLGSEPLEVDDLPSVDARFSWELKVPCVSPGRKTIDGVAARSGGSSSRGSSNPEFACFPIDECGEEDDDDADDADHICVGETGLLRDSMHCLSEDKEKGIDSASNTAGLGSHCTEISPSDSDTERRSNAELDCFPAGRGSEQDVNGVQALKTCQEETGCIRQPLSNISNSMVPAMGSLSNKALESFCRSSGTSELNDKTSQKSRNHSRRSGRLSQQKQSHNFSLGTSGVKKRSDSLKTRFSKPKASAKTSMEIRSVGISEKEPMRKNIVSNMSSFLPLVQQKQAAACAPVKKEVKVKALEAAEAAKRLAEKKENERKHKKEALKLERARMEQENLRRLELVKKAKEAEKKKKDAEIAARKRQREEDERKEKERKKKRVGEARTQQKGNAVQMSVDKAECRFQAEDGKTNRRNEGNAVTGNPMDVEQNDERAGTSLASNLAVSSSDKASDSNTACCSTPKPDQNYSSASQAIREKSYEISPYCCSDGEDEEEDDLSNNKFIPSWASKSNLRLALSSSNALNPSIVFPLKSFCSLNEVLLPRELQRR